MIGCNRLMPCSIIRGVQRCTAREASGNVLRNKRRIDSFLTQGYQPTTEELMDFSNVGYDESVCMLQSHVHRCLPILDASVILWVWFLVVKYDAHYILNNCNPHYWSISCLDLQGNIVKARQRMGLLRPKDWLMGEGHLKRSLQTK